MNIFLLFYLQVNALSCQAFSLVAAIAFYHNSHIRKGSITTRHMVSASIGVAIIVLCYGLQVLYTLYKYQQTSYCYGYLLTMASFVDITTLHVYIITLINNAVSYYRLPFISCLIYSNIYLIFVKSISLACQVMIIRVSSRYRVSLQISYLQTYSVYCQR